MGVVSGGVEEQTIVLFVVYTLFVVGGCLPTKSLNKVECVGVSVGITSNK